MNLWGLSRLNWSRKRSPQWSPGRAPGLTCDPMHSSKVLARGSWTCSPRYKQTHIVTKTTKNYINLKSKQRQKDGLIQFIEESKREKREKCIYASWRIMRMARPSEIVSTVSWPEPASLYSSTKLNVSIYWYIKTFGWSNKATTKYQANTTKQLTPLTQLKTAALSFSFKSPIIIFTIHFNYFN